MATIGDNLQRLKARIGRACASAGQPADSVALLAVSKTQASAAVRQAMEAGQRAFGENYVQEGLEKIAALADHRHELEWHFIGPLQSNKSRAVAEQFDWVHSIDRLKLAQRLSEQRPAQLPPLQVCIQVNISGEASKSGVSPQELPALAEAVAALPRLSLRGLMSIPEPGGDVDRQREPHRALAQCLAQLKALPWATEVPLDTLSMGMSDDLEAAIAEGSTLVRVGTAIFGARAPR
jgi:pyridoxal phosphate enzyme (YggS family)